MTPMPIEQWIQRFHFFYSPVNRYMQLDIPRRAMIDLASLELVVRPSGLSATGTKMALMIVNELRPVNENLSW